MSFPFSLKLFLTILAIVKEIASQSSCVSTPPRPPRCGKAMESSDDHISYSPYEYIGDNERCVWTIPAFSNSSTFQFHVLYTGFPYTENWTDSEPRLTISGIPIAENTYHDVSGPGSINVNGSSTVVIAFSSGPNARSLNMTGFVLEYEVERTIKQKTFISLETAHLRYYPSSGQYIDTSVVVVPPKYNLFPGTKFPLIYLEAGKTQESQRCTFKQDVYHYDRNNITNPWKHRLSFCNGIVSVSIPGHDDVMITTSAFQSGSNSVIRDQWYFHLKCCC